MAHFTVTGAHLMEITTRLMAYGLFNGNSFGSFGVFRGICFLVRHMAATTATIFAIAYKFQQLHQLWYLFSCTLSQIATTGSTICSQQFFCSVLMYIYVCTHAYTICTHSNISYQFPSHSKSVGLYAVRLSICYIYQQAKLSRSSLCSHNIGRLQMYSWHITLILLVSNLHATLCLAQFCTLVNAPVVM